MMEEVLRRFAYHGVKLKKEKCFSLQESVGYLGHHVDDEGLHPTQEKVEALTQARRPTDVAELKSFLGLLHYYQKFLPDLATVLEPLNRLTHQNVSWEWTVEREATFNKCKSTIVDAGVLVHYDVNLPIKLHCEASSYRLGAVLSHVMEDGTDRPIAFASRPMTRCERNYVHLQREALPLIYEVKHFHQYIFGRKFILVTDHKPLVTILGPQIRLPPMTTARLQRWAVTLSSYDYDIEYRKGSEHGNADCFSRLPREGTTESELDMLHEDGFDVHTVHTPDLPIDIKDVVNMTRRDVTVSRVYAFVMNGWPGHVKEEDPKPYFVYVRRHELATEAGCLLWGNRVIVPIQYRDRLLYDLHDTHPGMCRMEALARGYLWWPGQDEDITQKVQSCEACQGAKNSPAVLPLNPWNWPTRPWQ